MDKPAKHWFVLNHIKQTNAKAATPQAEVNRFNAINNDSLELFAPTFVRMVEHNGKPVCKSEPLTFHYVFVRGTSDDVKQLCSLPNGFSFVLNHSGESKYVTVSDKNMADFKAIARAYSNSLPCFSPDDITLEDGDLVEVVYGDFPGLTGTYIPKKGGKTGNIYIAVSHDLASVVYNIRAEYVRVLEFAKGSKRAYDQIEAFIPKLFKALRLYAADEPIPAPILSPLVIFCRRMSAVRIDNPKLDAKLQALLMCATHILGDTDSHTIAATRFARRHNAITSPWLQALILLLQAVTTHTPALLRDGLALLSPLTPTSSTHRLLLAEYAHHGNTLLNKLN